MRSNLAVPLLTAAQLAGCGTSKTDRALTDEKDLGLGKPLWKR